MPVTHGVAGSNPVQTALNQKWGSLGFPFFMPFTLGIHHDIDRRGRYRCSNTIDMTSIPVEFDLVVLDEAKRQVAL